MKSKGSILIESAIVYPIFFLTIVALMVFGIGMYQQVCAQYAVDTAIRHSTYYDQNEIGKINVKEGANEALDLYRRFSFDGSLVDDASLENDEVAMSDKTVDYLAGYTRDLFNAKSIYKADNVMVSVNKKNYLIYKTYTIEVVANYKIGISFVDAMLGSVTKGYVITADAEESIHDTAEFIRNVDFFEDLMYKLISMKEIKNPNGIVALV